MNFATRLREINSAMAAACRDAGRAPEEVRLIAVSKTFPAELAQGFYDAGQRLFGENKVQELKAKSAILPQDIQWHLIGHLQSNKAAAALECADWIDSVDSEHLLRRLDRIAAEKGLRPKILLEVNLGSEPGKTGASWDDLPALALCAASCRCCEWRGLMGMAPLADTETVRRCFLRLKTAAAELRKRFGLPLPELSMGMSGDFPVAIACGATMVRIGTALFGEREYPA